MDKVKKIMIIMLLIGVGGISVTYSIMTILAIINSGG